MIREYEQYHGAAIVRILHATKERVTIRAFSKVTSSAYVINDAIGIYIKYSGKRMPPWTFSFKYDHQQEIAKLFATYKKAYLILICHTDGIVTLSYRELKQILDHIHEPTEWIRVTRHKREKYTITGKDGKLNYKIGNSDFPSKLFT